MRAAIYARFSTEKQSGESVEDQLRECERLAERHGFTVVSRFSDAAISGGTTVRPGYQAMLAAARRGEFNVILAEDTSRLWRNMAEQAPRLAELADLGIQVVTHDLDTRVESAGMLGAVLGASSEAYRREIGRRTRRGLEGRARQGKPAGGRAYGYIPAAQSGSGKIEIDERQAEIVREIFTKYADGWTSQSIANEFNRRGVASPGSSWERTKRRAGGWMCTAIAGDAKRGTGILNNEVYRGRVIWNRMRWQRSATDSSKRRALPNPPAEWVTRDDESLRIVPQELWERVKARQGLRVQTHGHQVRKGLRSVSDRGGPKYLFSGLLKCGECGFNFIMGGKNHYTCSSYKFGGVHACSNSAYLKRSEIEPGLLAGIKRELFSAEAIDELQRRVRQRVRAAAPAPDSKKEIVKLEKEAASLVDAVASGALTSSPGIAARLQQTETELARLRARPIARDPEKLLPALAERAREAIAGLEYTLLGDHRRARQQLLENVGQIRVSATPEEIKLEAIDGHLETVLLARTGTSGSRQKFLVAGAGFSTLLMTIPRKLRA